MRFPRWIGGKPAPLFSIVVCSIDEEKFRRVIENFGNIFHGTPIEFIPICNARSLSEAYNRGIREARGKYIIFSHDDIRLITPDFVPRLLAHFEQFDLIGVAGTTRLIGGAWFLAGEPYDFQLVTSPHAEPRRFVIVGRGRGSLVIRSVQALDGLFIATRSEIARTIGFDAETFDHFHLYDLDFTYRAYLAGFRLGICRDLFIIHESSGRFDGHWEIYKERFEKKFSHVLASVPANREPSAVSNVLLDETVLSNTSTVAELCAPQTLLRFIPS